MYSPLPNHPWEKVGSDLFELNGSTYLLVVDYFSCFIEIQKLSSINSRSVLLALKAIFSRHRVPATLVSNNGPQYASPDGETSEDRHPTTTEGKEWKERQKSDYDKRHRVKNLTPLPDDQPVWVQTGDRQVAGRVIQPAATPRSYIVQTPSGQLRRNRSHLIPRPEGSQMDTSESDPHDTPDSNPSLTRRIVTRSSTGTYVGPPPRLTYWRKGDVA